MENLIKFSTEEEWESSNLEYPDVASIEESNRIEYLVSHKPVGNLETAGGIVLWDAENERKVVVESGYTTENYPEDNFIPIGVLVCPASHMPDGRARMMSLRWMSCDDPENGSLTYQNMCWGVYGTDLTGLTNFTEVPFISSATNQTISGVNSNGYLSSDYSGYTGASNPQDPGTRWDNSSYRLASPYAADGTPNPLYRATSYSGGSLSNPLSYFDGRHQSDVILEARGAKDYGSWKPTYNVPADFPAVSVCDMYHTVGTNQGDWYLPSQAEMGYIVARLNDINNAITKVNGMQDLPSYWAWSSSEYSSFLARTVGFLNGNVYYWYRNESYIFTVVAFCPV